MRGHRLADRARAVAHLLGRAHRPRATVAWTLRALRDVRAELSRHGLDAARPVPPAGLPRSGLWLVRTVLRRRGATCLEGSMVLQAWWLGQGQRVDVVVGVSSDGGFHGHAWLDGIENDDADGYVEIKRVVA